MMRILFVDDEQFVLDGLRNVLRKQRSRWDMSFIASGPAALAHMELQPQDVVVSDMRMPGMDGAQLLEQIRHRFPATIRIVLTGQASQEDMVRVLPIAQQILSKPCDPQVLCDAIERLSKVKSLLRNDALQNVVGCLGPVPSFPKYYQQLSEAIERDGVSVADIVAIVERDPAFSVRVLALANTAYFGLRKPTTSIHAAVTHIGFSLVRSLALTTEVFSKIPASLLQSETLTKLPERSMLRACLAKRYVLDRALAEEAFTAGLVLDIGYMVLAQCQPDTYLELLALSERTNRPMHEVEFERFGVTHADVGAYLLAVWGLPDTLCGVVAAHHEPALVEVAGNPVATAVHVADVLAHSALAGEGDPLAGIADAIRARPEIAERLDDWLGIAQLAVAPA